MKFVLMLLGVLLAALGIAVGVVSQKDFGVALIGLNLGVAATLLAGGLIVLGLGAVVSSVDALLHKMRLATGPAKTQPVAPPTGVLDNTPPPPPAASKSGTGLAVGAGAGALAAGSLAASMQKAGDKVDTAMDKVAEAASEAKDSAVSTTDKAADTVIDVVATSTETATDAAQTAGDSIDKATDVVETAADAALTATTDTADATVKTAEEITETANAADKETSDDVSAARENTEIEAAATVQQPVDAPDIPSLEGEESPADETDSETADIAPQDEPAADDGQLYVVEELVIRNRPARTLSDGTLEAETAEGWMRFENAEHLEEYLDAMEG